MVASSRARTERDRDIADRIRRGFGDVAASNRVAARRVEGLRRAQADGAARFLEQTALGSPWAEDAHDREAERAWWTARRVADGFKSRG